MMTSTQIKVVITLAVVIWGALLFLQGVSLKTDYLKPYSIVVGGVILVGTVYDLYLWRMWPFSLFGPRPILRGTWRGQLTSTWRDSKTGSVLDPIDVYLVVHQRSSTVWLRLMSRESRSASTSAGISEISGGYQLSSTYLNVPKILVREGSAIHHGSLIFEIGNRFPRRLEGSYWTDRKTTGELLLNAHSPATYSDFDEAAEGKYEAGVQPRLGPWRIGRIR
jgi:hypothetical protein